MEDEHTNEPPPLGGTDRDRGVGIAKATIGAAIPVFGSLVNELINVLIPQQRIERLEDYVRYLYQRLESLSPSEAQQKFKNRESIDLFEDGAMLAIRSLTDERQRHIAEVVAGGIRGEHQDRIEAKRVLDLLRQVDDDQIVILLSHLSKNSQDESFWEKHSRVLTPVGAHMGSDQTDLDREVIHELARDHLIRLGLLSRRFKQPRKGELPEFDPRTGSIKAQGQEITPLGRLLLSRIGTIERGEV